MPDGLIPDIQIEDDPIQAYQIGDVNEPLLKQALTEAGRSYEADGVRSRSAASPHFKALPPVKSTTLRETYPADSIICFFTLQIMVQ